MKLRLDSLLALRNIFDSREKAKGHILAGNIVVNNKVLTKPGMKVDDSVTIHLKNVKKYVSRGGYKLEQALKLFPIDVKGLVTVDIGASTGGFTDCLIQNGAKLVYSVDVGFNQIDYKLRVHPRVVVLENFNAKSLTKEVFDYPIQLAVVDLSFISLTKVLEPIILSINDKRIVALVKPQFEVGQEVSNFKGVVKHNKDHIKALEKVSLYANSIGLYVNSVTYSPIKGPKGNIEFLIYLTDQKLSINIDFKLTVDIAHKHLI
jgi:23S rRNA (cytidine1920-2'-O)/16S rRNA (cytidine1409-2'-O)-methyltransferase